MIKGFRHIPSRVAVIAIIGSFFLFNGFNSVPVYAASDISVSNSGKVSFGKVSASSTGTLATGQDTLNITTDCEAGVNVYATSVNGSGTGTSLINLAAKEQDTGGTNTSSYTIATSSNTIGSPGSLENNTWGLNVINNNTYYGLPEYSASGLPTVIYSGTNTELPIYYGAKVTNSLAPGTYTGEVLYTVTVNNSCLDYTVKFDKNASSASGDMSDQSILPTGGTLSENSFTYSGYSFLGWSLDPAGKTGTAINGIGTAEDVDFADKASFPGSNESILPGSETTLYAIWEKQTIYMQNWFGCAKMQQNEIVTLTDSRDNHEYKVKKLPDGKCWMINNLTLTATDLITEGKALTSANTNIPDSDTNSYYITPKNARYNSTGSFNNSAVASASALVDFSTSYPNYIQIGYRDKNTTDNDTGNPVPEDTAYYNFYTATLGYSYYNDGKSSGSSAMDICPKGWRLPKVSDNGTSSIVAASSEFANLARAYNGSASWSGSGATSYDYYTSDATIRQNMIKGDASSLDPELDTNGSAGFTYAGSYSSTTLNLVGTRGYYWSSSVYTSSNGYSLRFTTSNVTPQSGSSKSVGNAVRCVAQYSDVSGYMQDFDTNDLASGESTTLLDKRDNQEYTVYRIPTDATYPGTSDAANVAGKVIMTKDLNLGAKASVAGSASTIVANGAMTLSPEDSNFTTPTGTDYEGIAVPTTSVSITNGTGSWNTSTNSYSNKQYTTSGTGSYANRGYYSWGAAMTVCPKGWRLPTQDEYNNNDSSWNASTTGISKLVNNNLSTVQSSPWSFVLGGYYNGSFSNAGSLGRYWSSAQYSSTYSYYLLLSSSSGLLRDRDNKYFGFSVRCIAKESYTINYNANGGTGEIAPSKGYIGGGTTLSRNTFTKDGYYFVGWSTDPSATSPTYTDGATISTDLAPAGGSVTLYAVWSDTALMQNWSGCSTLENGATTSLKDLRDGSIYTIKKFGSGSDAECWMTQNLTLGYDQTNNVAKGYTLTKDDTNIPDNTTYYLPPAGKRGSVTSSSTVTATNAAVFDSSTAVSEAQVQYRAAGQSGDQSSTGTLFQNTGYYNYPAATLGYSYYNDGLSSGNSPRDICPAGWQLPRGSSTSTYSFYWLDRALGGTGANRTDATTRDKFLNDASFGYSGYYSSSQLYYVGSRGYWWSSTLYSSTNAYYMYWNSDGLVYPQGYNVKYLGFSIRCVAKPSYTINYNANGGTGEMTPSNGYIGGSTTLSQNTFTRDGYYFAGWSTDSSATSPVYTNGAAITENLASAGGSTTLYAVWFSADRIMQNWSGCSALGNEATTSLMDLRDSSIYTIKKFGSKCWMISNLILGHDKGYTLTSEDTNIPDGTTYYLPPAGKRGSVTSSSTLTSTDTATFDTSNASQAHVQYRAAGQPGDQESTGTLSQNTGYYNFPAATLGFSYYDDGKTSGTSPRDICPKGWKIPIYGSYSTEYSWSSLDYAINPNASNVGTNRTDTTSRNNLLNKASFSYVGRYTSSELYEISSWGNWWSSTIYDSIYSHHFPISNSSSHVGPQNWYHKYHGYAVRCVAK